VGEKFSLALPGGDRLDVVVLTSGEREVFFFRRGEEQPFHSVRLDPPTACALGAVLCPVLGSKTEP
jgi:K+/H+ antiporter YhaU regulatory subunit KhtT